KKYDVVADDWDTAIIAREQYEAALAEKEHPLPWDEKNKPCPTLGAECRGCPDCGRRVSCTSDDITDDAVRAEIGMNSRALDAALAAKNDGWIDWSGGECPVIESAMVDVRYRDGSIHKAQRADSYEWGHGYAHFVTTGADIIAYRLHKPQEAEQAKADDEADLNECIGQDAAPVWNGEGLPPVGCECEYLDSNNEWYPVTIKYASNQIVVICGMTNIFGEKQETEIAKDIQLDKPQFRPIRSEAERKRDAAKNAIAELCRSSASNGHSADLIYDAIAAGKIPGVKLED
ncbi:hypothetical protein ACYBYO_25965, partial [Klebsiella pneumoniae]